MVKMQTHIHNFRLNSTTDEKYILRKMGFKFKTLSSAFFSKQHFIYFLLKNKNPLGLRDQGDHSGTSKNGRIRLCASSSSETALTAQTAHKISSRNSALSIFVLSIKMYVRSLLYHHYQQKCFTISENCHCIYHKKLLLFFFLSNCNAEF